MKPSKSYTVKKVMGEKSVVVLDVSADILLLYKMAKKEDMPFLIKCDNGYQQWGTMNVADYLGVNDVTKLFN